MTFVNHLELYKKVGDLTSKEYHYIIEFNKLIIVKKMVLGLDNLDFAVLCTLALIVAAYLSKEKLLLLISSDDSSIMAMNSPGCRDIMQVIKENNKNYLILYGSQTGTTEDYAKRFGKELTAKFSLNVMCADVENYDFDSLCHLPNDIVVSFFFSTYGEGDFPDGALNFETYITSLNSGDLSNLKYTLFGLGNSTYEFYNSAAKKTQKLLDAAGANLIGSLGLGDDGAGTTDEDYLSWKDLILEHLKDVLHLSEHEQRFESSFDYKILTAGDFDKNKIFLGEPSKQYLPSEKLSYNNEGKQLGPFDLNYPYIAPITTIKELFESSDRNCIHVEFDLSGSNLKYSTGDHLVVWPSNSNEYVEKFLSCFDLDESTVFELIPKDFTLHSPFPVPTTIGAAVRYYLEITGPVSRQIFSSLVQYINNEELKSKVINLSKDKHLFASEITSKYFNLADALLYLSNGSKWSFIPWNFLVETVPHLQPRYYSISSSSAMEKQIVHITAVVENIENLVFPQNGPVLGTTTNLLRNIQLEAGLESSKISSLPVHYDLNGPRGLFSNYKLPIHISRSQFRLPSNPSTPVIMIGPGTGVAPFRGFVRERVNFVQSQPNIKLGKHLLFYGSRNIDDFLYKHEWPVYSKQLGESFEMIVAHSRLLNEKKVYVQDCLLERGQEIFDLVNQGAFIYVCGDAKGMAKGVHDSLVKILCQYKQITEDNASEILKMFKLNKRYQEDVW